MIYLYSTRTNCDISQAMWAVSDSHEANFFLNCWTEEQKPNLWGVSALLGHRQGASITLRHQFFFFFFVTYRDQSIKTCRPSCGHPLCDTSISAPSSVQSPVSCDLSHLFEWLSMSFSSIRCSGIPLTCHWLRVLVELSAVDLQPSLTAGRQITGLQSFFSTSRVELVSPRQPYILKLILFFVFFFFFFVFSE